MKTNVYVDGFNLYFGALRRTPYRWLDLRKLCENLLPKHDIHRIRYFTALVKARDDAQKPQRQQIYLRALRTLPNVTIHLGHYLVSTTRMPLVTPLPNQPRTVEVIKTEEKGSDVNLATHLLVDAFDGDCEAAVVISNDSDLLEPIKVVRERFRRTVGLLNPQQHPSQALKRVASFCHPIREGVLRVSQLPPTLTDKNGTITKPAGW